MDRVLSLLACSGRVGVDPSHHAHDGVLNDSVVGRREGYWSVLPQKHSVLECHPTRAVNFDYILPHLEDSSSFVLLVGMRASLVLDPNNIVD